MTWGEDLVSLMSSAHKCGIERLGPRMYFLPSEVAWLDVVVDELVKREPEIRMLGRVDCHEPR